MIRGKGEFDRQDIITALTTSAGNSDVAFADLCRPPPPTNSPPPPLDERRGLSTCHTTCNSN